MKPTALRCLGEYPFLDGIELSALSGLPQRSVFRHLRRLSELGYVASLPPATAHIPRTRRPFLTALGVRQFTLDLGVETAEALQSIPYRLSGSAYSSGAWMLWPSYIVWLLRWPGRHREARTGLGFAGAGVELGTPPF